jgi:hypothetical protein
MELQGSQTEYVDEDIADDIEQATPITQAERLAEIENKQHIPVEKL